MFIKFHTILVLKPNQRHVSSPLKNLKLGPTLYQCPNYWVTTLVGTIHEKIDDEL